MKIFSQPTINLKCRISSTLFGIWEQCTNDNGHVFS